MTGGADQRGELIVLSAPSGTGKTTLIQRMMEGPLAGLENLVFSVSHTTRAARRGEVDGRDYHFVDRRRFERLIDEDRLLEWAEVNGQLYGTSREEVDSRLERGVDVVVELDPEGAKRLRARRPGARTVWVASAEPGVSSSGIELYDRNDCVIMLDDAKRAGGDLAAALLGPREENRGAKRVEKRP